MGEMWRIPSRINDGNGRLALEEAEVQRIWKKYYEDLYNIDIHEQFAVHLSVFVGVRRGNFFEGEPIRRMELEVKVGKLKNGKPLVKDEVTGEMIKGRGDRVLE